MGELSVGTRNQGDITIVDIEGSVDTVTSGKLSGLFDKLLADKAVKIVVNLSKAKYINSAGWGIFLGNLKRVKMASGNIVLAQMSEEVRHIYTLLGFKSFLKQYPTEAEAIATYSGG